ncbi:MAG: hypothetical protein U1F76_06540 [Candidatus Competibacteraceae bacterium]
MRHIVIVWLLISLNWLSMSATLAANTPTTVAANHVRVVLDISKSMDHNDPGKLAKLSTLLLRDLAQPNTTLGSSFKVIPFDLDWRWVIANRPPPANVNPIIAMYNRRDEFVRSLINLRYEAECTYFYPGLRASIDDLDRIPIKSSDTRTIVIITDGLPDNNCRSGIRAIDIEPNLIEQDLLRRIENKNILLYILAFGTVADTMDANYFFNKITKNQSLGRFIIERTGDDLLTDMLTIFGEALGYDVDTALHLSSSNHNHLPLDLEKKGRPERVAVVVFGKPKPLTLPTLTLLPPPQKQLNITERDENDDLSSAASYSLAWVASPEPGLYDFTSDAVQGTVAVLRPTKINLTIVPPIRYVMAKTNIDLTVKARSFYEGKSVDNLKVNYFLSGLGGGQDSWQDSGAPMPGSTGGDYKLRFQFHDKPDDRIYKGKLSVKAKLNIKEVSSVDLDVDVYPFLSIFPDPGLIEVNNALKIHDREECKIFDLKLKSNSYWPPQPPMPSYRIRAFLDPQDISLIDNEFNKASFKLDGLPLFFGSQSGSQQGSPPQREWYKQMTKQELLGGHEICIQIGEPKRGNPTQPIDLPVKFVLDIHPYDKFNVIEPLTFRVHVAEPPSLWKLWLLLISLTLLATALLWYYRNRPTLAPDLGYAIAPDGPSAQWVSRPLGEGSWPAWLLGLTVEKPIMAEGHDRPLAWVRPVDGELYRLRPAQGTRLETVEPMESVPLQRGLATVSVQRTYRLNIATGAYRLRLEYR